MAKTMDGKMKVYLLNNYLLELLILELFLIETLKWDICSLLITDSTRIDSTDFNWSSFLVLTFRVNWFSFTCVFLFSSGKEEIEENFASVFDEPRTFKSFLLADFFIEAICFFYSIACRWWYCRMNYISPPNKWGSWAK